MPHTVTTPLLKDFPGWSCLLVPDDPTEFFLSPNDPLHCHVNDDIENHKYNQLRKHDNFPCFYIEL